MKALGYPGSDFDPRAAEISIDHLRVVVIFGCELATKKQLREKLRKIWERQ
jgi:hypothetical protein